MRPRVQGPAGRRHGTAPGKGYKDLNLADRDVSGQETRMDLVLARRVSQDLEQTLQRALAHDVTEPAVPVVTGSTVSTVASYELVVLGV